MSEFLLYLENNDGVNDAQQHRMVTNALRSRSNNFAANNLNPAFAGVKQSSVTSCNVTQNGLGANMSVDISNGQVFVQPVTSTRAGCYVWTTDDVVNVPITASDATLDRIDILGIQVSDTQYGDLTNSVAPSVVTGTAAGSPVAPTIPDGFTPLAQIAVAHASTTVTNANISQYQNAVGHGAAAGGWMTQGAINNGVISVAKPTSPVPGQVMVDQVHGYAEYASGLFTNVWRPFVTSGLTFGWTPALTATVTNPTQGTGTGRVLSGRYRYISPKVVWFTCTYLFGTTGRNAGSGNYRMSLPLPANANFTANTGYIHGRYLNATDGTNKEVTGLKITSADTFAFSYWDVTTHTTSTVSAVAPFTPGVSSGFQITGIYEIA